MPLYHHSTLMHLPFVLASGELRPSRADVHGQGQRGLLWFSANARLEASAVKRGPKARRADYPRVRFTIDVAHAMHWTRAAKLAGYSTAVQWRLEAAGRRLGASPSEWWARLDPLSITNVSEIDVFVAKRWIALDRAELRVEQRSDEAARLHVHGLAYEVERVRLASGEWAYAARLDQLHGVVHRLAGLPDQTQGAA
jgi:hypothetical protein